MADTVTNAVPQPIMVYGRSPSGVLQAVTTDGSGNLDVNVVVGGGSSSVNINGINGSPPALTNPLFVELSDGTNAFGTVGNPLSENIAQWGGTAVQAAATAANDGTGANPVVRSTQRRFSQILTTTPLAGNGVFNSAWFDTNQTGDVSIIATLRADQAGATNGFLIQEADDTTDANFIFNVTASLVTGFATGVTIVANTTTPITAQIRRRFWRVQYTNGATLQGSFKLAVTANPVLVGNAISSSGSAANLGAGGQIVGIGAINQTSIASDNQIAIGTIGGVNDFNFVYAPNGTTNNWYYLRTPIVFKTASIAATSTTTASNPIWTPTSGKKFRLMRFQITAQGLSATSSASVTVSLVDSASTITIGTYDVDVPAVANIVSGVNNISGNWIDLGNGFLSAVANNVLNFGISAAGAGTTGTYRINVCGTEE